MDLSSLNKLKVSVIPRAKLASYTTFKLGGSCSAMVECQNAQELTEAVRIIRTYQLPFLLMGFGSNILVSDKGIDRIIVRFTSAIPAIAMTATTNPGIAELSVDAATQLDDLVSFSIENGLKGMTVFSGIPGTVGGAVAGNAGAYGQQLSDLLITLTILKPDDSIVTVPKSAVRFAYRDSDLKHNGDIVLSATLQLPNNGDIEEMKNKRAHTIAVREEKHGRWQQTPCAGSFFRNVEPTSKAGPRQSAGWFLEQAGCKNMNLNGAHPYDKHANIVTRDDGASAQDIYDLTCQMAATVKEKFGLELSREVRLLGQFDNAPDCNLNGYW